MSSTTSGKRFRPRAWHIGRFVVGIGLGALALYALNGQRNELIGASGELARLNPLWLIVAIAVEVISFTCFADLQRRFLRAGGVRVTIGRMTGFTLAAGAIADSMPAGPAFASVFAFRFYRRKGANDALAGWVLVGTLVCASLALALLAAGGALLAFSESSSYDLIGVIFGVLVISALADAIVWQRRWLAHVIVLVLSGSRRLIGRPRRHGLEVVQGLLASLEAVRFTGRDMIGALASGVGNWVFDCGCLVCSFLAVGAPIPWRGLLLAYGAGQLAANLPITPGGFGLVEGSLTIALVAFGGAETSTVAAVLCYRIVSFWGYLPVGWVSWMTMTLLRRRSEHADAHAVEGDTHEVAAQDRRESSLATTPSAQPTDVREGGT